MEDEIPFKIVPFQRTFVSFFFGGGSPATSIQGWLGLETIPRNVPWNSGSWISPIFWKTWGGWNASKSVTSIKDDASLTVFFSHCLAYWRFYFSPPVLVILFHLPASLIRATFTARIRTRGLTCPSPHFRVQIRRVRIPHVTIFSHVGWGNPTEGSFGWKESLNNFSLVKFAFRWILTNWLGTKGVMNLCSVFVFGANIP